MCTPLVYRGLVYIVKYNGVLSVYDAKTGEEKFQQRLAGRPSAFTSSPIAADGKIYVASEEGRVFVLKAGPAFELLAENDMAESVLATPAISEGTLLYRTRTTSSPCATRGDAEPRALSRYCFSSRCSISSSAGPSSSNARSGETTRPGMRS